MFSRTTTRSVLEYSCALAAVLQAANSRRYSDHRMASKSNCLRTGVSTTTLLIALYSIEAVTIASQFLLPSSSGRHSLHLVALIFSWLLNTCSHKLLTTTTLAFEIPILALSNFDGLGEWRTATQMVCRAGRIALLFFMLAVPGCGQAETKASSVHGPSSLEHDAKDSSGNQSEAVNCEKQDDSDLDSDDDDDFDDELLAAEHHGQRLKEAGGWFSYLKSFSLFLPYMWPRDDVKVQLCIAVCLLSITIRRALNIIIPLQFGRITTKLLEGTPPYRELAICFVLSLLNENSGFGMIQSLAKIPIRQFSERQVTNAAFSHVMSLSFDFHSEKDSAEIIKALEQGGALMNVLATVVNEILPTLADLILGLGMLYWKFNIYVPLLTMVAFGSYLMLEIVTSSWKIKYRRQLGRAEREETRVMHQAIQGWTTVCYFNTFGFEKQRFGGALGAKMAADWDWNIRDICIKGVVEILDPLAFFLLACMVIHGISQEWFPPGDFVFLVEYWAYLIWPLKWLSGDYRLVLSDLVDAERLLTLLQTKPTVADKQQALEMDSVSGHVAFKDVGFAYDPRKPAIKDLSFSVRPGETIAFVGATGAGKSTVTKLLCRFYDVSGGQIEIDGHDIRDIALDSLRNIIGVVPQDPLLFNATIRDNLRYAKPSATDEEIFEACRVAAIHDKILTFVDGYNTRVGERGVKLSGGEVQRLAVARVILKDPSVLILDEATSAVDTKTESEIQKALDIFKMGRQRATLVVAHRLSTIIGADRIVVLQDGQCVESGTHEELLEKNGEYRNLWNKQVGIKSQNILEL